MDTELKPKAQTYAGTGAIRYRSVLAHCCRPGMSAIRQVLNIAYGGIAFQLVDGIEPLAAIDSFDMGQQLMQHFPQIADEGNIHLDILVYFRGIDLNVYLLRIGRVGLQISRYAIVEAHSKSQQQVSFLNGMIHPGFPVHAHHPQIEWMRCWERTQSQKGERHRNSGFLGKLANFRHGSGDDDAVARQNDRPLGVVN